MADTEDPSIGSLFSAKKRIPKDSFYAYLFSSVVVDVIEFMGVPGAVDLYIAFCRGMYFYNGYKTDGMAVATWSEAVAGVVPYVDELPLATAFTLWTYFVNVSETSKVESLVAGTTLAANTKKEIAAAGVEDSRDRVGMRNQEIAMEKERMNDGTRGSERSAAPEGRRPLRNDVTAMSTASKTIGYASSARNTLSGENASEKNQNGLTTPSVDGIRRTDGYSEKTQSGGSGDAYTNDIRNPGELRDSGNYSGENEIKI